MVDADRAWGELRAIAVRGRFDESRLAGLPAPAARYLRHTLAAGAPLSTGTRLRMRGRFKPGLTPSARWLPFTAEQVLAPGTGFVWRASMGWGPLAIKGHDLYYHGEGQLRWKLAGFFPVAQSGGGDIARSARGRLVCEAVMAPQSLLDLPGIEWQQTGDESVAARWDVDGEPSTVRIDIDGDGRPRAAWIDRWGDPEQQGEWGFHPFGAEFLDEHRFGSMTLPRRLRAGWWYGTERWPEGVFFEARITAASPLPPPKP